MFFVAFLDLIFFNVAQLLSFALRFGGSLPWENFSVYSQLWPYFTVIALFSLYVNGLYDRQRLYDRLGILLDLARSVTMSTFGLVIIAFFGRGFAMPRSVILFSWLITFVFLGILRLLLNSLAFNRRNPQGIIVVGAGKTAKDVASEIEKYGMGLYRITIFSGDEVQNYGELPKLLKESGAKTIILAEEKMPSSQILSILFSTEGLGAEIFLLPGLYELFLGISNLRVFLGMPLFSLNPPESKRYQLLKRYADIFISLLGIVFFSVILPPLIILIKIDSRGPVFYRQKRLGKGGRPFIINKLRTMQIDAEAETGPILALPQDARITRFGRWLRRTRLDEFPQLINVLSGEMSLVGPRPERPELYDKILPELPSFKLRMKVKPGITGMAQIYGRYDTSPENKLRYDLAYIKGHSTLIDIQLIFETLRVLFTGHGAR